MKEKISIMLSSDVLAKVDGLAGSRLSRSAFIERVLRGYFRERAQKRIHARDLERLNAVAERLNEEVEEVLSCQILDEL